MHFLAAPEIQQSGIYHDEMQKCLMITGRKIKRLSINCRLRDKGTFLWQAAAKAVVCQVSPALQQRRVHGTGQ